MLLRKTGKIILVVICLLWVAITFYKPYPGVASIGEMFTYSSGVFSVKNNEVQGTIELNSKDVKDLRIFIDSLGIPHIYGATSKDLAFGVGYMHASDRYFQMEVLTRSVQGQLSGLVGDLGLSQDMQWVVYEFDKKAQEVYEEMEISNPAVYKDLNYYAKGVNFYLENLSGNEVSPEYRLFKGKPRKWKPHYSILLSWYMSDVLTHYNGHSERQIVMDKLNEDLLNVLYTQDTTGYPYAIEKGEFSYSEQWTKTPPVKGEQSLADGTGETILEREIRQSIGSNHWAVGAEKSKNGTALLSNDTHLNLSLPSSWYEVHLVCNDFETYGLTLPCSPYVVSGTNEHISWGITNAHWDLTETFVLKINPKDSTQYWFENTWVRFKDKTYTIPLQNGAETKVSWTLSKLGPVVEENGEWVVKTWYPNEKNSSITAFRELALAKNWPDFKEALRYYTYPSQNFAYADVDGNVGMISAGKLPYRSKNHRGGMRDGTKRFKPTFVPYDSLPMMFNGTQGFVFSANQAPARTNYYINYDWPDKYRANRISSLLNEKAQYDIKDMLRIQGDIKDVSVADLQKIIKKYDSGSELWKIVKPLKSWDGTIDHDSYEAVLHYYFTFLLKQEFQERLSKGCEVGSAVPLNNLYALLLKQDRIDLCGTSLDFRKLLETSIRKTHEQFIADYGKGYEKKATYSHHGVMTVEHMLQIPGFGAWVYNSGGNGQTVNINVNRVHGASMRTNFEMTSPVTGYMIIAGGQSGKPNDSNYKDQLEDWKNVQYHKIQFESNPDKLRGIVGQIKIN